MNEQNRRLPYLDNAKLAMMFLVVYGHLLESALTQQPSHAAHTLYLLIYLFHMPVWVFLAGLSSRVETTLRDCGRLLSLLIVFQAFYVLLLSGLRHNYREWIVTPWWILWFILSLIIWKMLLPLARKSRWTLALAIVAALGAGASGWIGRPFSLSRTVVWFPFFLVGHIYGKRIIGWARTSTRVNIPRQSRGLYDVSRSKRLERGR